MQCKQLFFFSQRLYPSSRRVIVASFVQPAKLAEFVASALHPLTNSPTVASLFFTHSVLWPSADVITEWVAKLRMKRLLETMEVRPRMMPYNLASFDERIISLIGYDLNLIMHQDTIWTWKTTSEARHLVPYFPPSN